MHSVQAGARVAETPEKLRSFYEDSLSAAEFNMRGNPEGLETVTTYINACIQRLESDTSAFDELTQPPIFSMPDGMLAYADNNKGIILIG